MSNSQCKACRFEDEKGTKVDDSMTNVAWARELGVAETSIRRHKAHTPTVAQASGFVDENGMDALAASIDVPDEFVTSRGMSLRDPLTGSWQKINWQPNKKALHDSLRYNDLKEALDGWTFETRALPGRSGGYSLFIALSDFQIGKANQRMGGTPETLARIRRSVSIIVSRLADMAPADLPTEIVLWDGGDSVENHWNTPEQIATNDLPLPEQIRVARRIFLEIIKAFAPFANRVVFISVPSNHGQSRVGYKAAGGTVDADFGLEISYQLEDAVNENPFLAQRVRFVRPEALYETAVYEASGTKIALHHGHRSNSQKGHGRWWADQSHGRMPGWDADILFTAHFHNLGLTQSGNGRWIIETSSSDAGSDWFSNKSGQTAVQGLTVVELLDGGWRNLEVV
ncbi:exonuclease [Microbacterium phage PhillyPhilly]|nr:exonuclease [Microbacterium phage PhillyPhilly]